MARRFSKEELAKGPSIRKRKFVVYVVLRNMDDEAFLVNEEVEAQEFEIDSNEHLLFFDLDDLGEPVYRAIFKEWLWTKEVRAFESADRCKPLLEDS